MRSLNQMRWLQRLLMRLRLAWLNRFWGMSIHPTVRISMTAKLDKTYPKGMHLGAYSYGAFGLRSCRTT